MTRGATAGAAVPFSSPNPATLWRHQLPVYSPISAAALRRGLLAAASARAAERARAELIALLEQRFGAAAVLLTDSGTTALTAALIAAVERRPGAAAVLPAFACYDVATAADGARAPALLYDVDPRTLAPDLDSLRAALRRSAAAIVVPHLYGYAVDLAAVNELAAEQGAVVIEDAAQAAGATLDGPRRVAGAQAALSVLSFGRGKGWTGGGGGALLAFDATGQVLLERARALLGAPRGGARELFALAGQLVLARPGVYALPAALPFLRLGETVYRAPQRLRAATGAACAAAVASWPLVEAEIAARRRNAERLLAALRGQAAFAPIRPGSRTYPGYLRLPVLASAPARSAAGERRATRLGVSPAYPRALCDLEGFAERCANRDAAFPGSRLLAARLCTLPTHSRLSSQDLAEVVSWTQAVGGQ